MIRNLTLWFFLPLSVLLLLFPGAGNGAVAPVGQLPTVTVSATPSIYILPLLSLTEMKEWQDFGIQVHLKVYANGEEQLSRVIGNEWDVAVMNPYHAVKGGNEGDVVIIGLAGDFSGPLALLSLRGGRMPGMDQMKDWPAFLVAASSYADTRKTVVLRFLEGYGRGLQVIRGDPVRAAARLKAFYKEKSGPETSVEELRKEIERTFFFDERQREAPFQRDGERGSAIENFAKAVADAQVRLKVLEARKDPTEYILAGLCGQLAELRREAEGQLQKTQAAIADAAGVGAPVKEFLKKWEEARAQMLGGRGCLAVIGILSDLQRSAEQAKGATRRLGEFRRIELGIGLFLALYYAGYAVRRKKKKQKAEIG